MIFKRISTMMVIPVIIICFTIPAKAQDDGFCKTWEIYKKDQIEKYGMLYHDCDNGDCDDPENRDAAIPDPEDPIKYVRLYFHIFCEDNGSNCATNELTLAAQVNDLNSEYLPIRIQFVYDYRFVNSTLYRYNPNASSMKNAYAVAPDSQMNIYVTDAGGGSFGTFPWDDVRLPLSNQGGVVLTEGHVYPMPYHDNVLAHEIGHNLGLWHTHHGVSEVTQCGECYEMANGVDADITGDLCSDTPPTPVNSYCNDPGGIDPCCNEPWGQTAPQNYMGYSTLAGYPCWTEFTPQQWGRIHCWTDEVLSSWYYVQPEDTCLACSIDMITPYVPNVGGVIMWDMTVSNCGSYAVPVYGELYPTLDGCDGSQHDFDINRQITENLDPSSSFTGNYFYAVPPVPGITGTNAITINVGTAIDDYITYCCADFIFFSSWGDQNGPGEIWGGGEWLDRRDTENLPMITGLDQNFPNPFNATTSISFHLANSGNVSLRIYNLAGQLIETLIDGYTEAGLNNVHWEASQYSSGIYFYKLTVGDMVFIKRMTLLK